MLYQKKKFQALIVPLRDTHPTHTAEPTQGFRGWPSPKKKKKQLTSNSLVRPSNNADSKVSTGVVVSDVVKHTIGMTVRRRKQSDEIKRIGLSV